MYSSQQNKESVIIQLYRICYTSTIMLTTALLLSIFGHVTVSERVWGWIQVLSATKRAFSYSILPSIWILCILIMYLLGQWLPVDYFNLSDFLHYSSKQKQSWHPSCHYCVTERAIKEVLCISSSYTIKGYHSLNS